MLRRSFVALCSKGSLPDPKTLIGEWGYGTNYYTISEDSKGNVIYFEKYPRAIAGRQFGRGTIRPSGHTSVTEWEKGTDPSFEPPFATELDGRCGVIWFAKRPDGMLSLYKPPEGPVLKGFAMKINSRKMEREANEAEIKRRMQVRENDIKKTSNIKLAGKQFALAALFLSVFGAGVIFFPDEYEIMY
eukprot:TRINITY_DN12234_c0_g1_i1.p1 TRINITY_DN12234_c0_g1~~TRINITY_DN12234_c0_g1_i1.p1  ORF type:complete len:206 (+),score=22.40 TRINITY_DN12234_c0_g1_i1:56-619(+)